MPNFDNLPDLVRKPVTLMYNEVNSAGAESVNILADNCSAQFGGIRKYIKTTEHVERAIANSEIAISALIDILSHLGMTAHLKENKKVIENARGVALNSIIDLRDELIDARPSDRAVALGFG